MSSEEDELKELGIWEIFNSVVSYIRNFARELKYEDEEEWMIKAAKKIALEALRKNESLRKIKPRYIAAACLYPAGIEWQIIRTQKQIQAVASIYFKEGLPINPRMGRCNLHLCYKHSNAKKMGKERLTHFKDFIVSFMSFFFFGYV